MIIGSDRLLGRAKRLFKRHIHGYGSTDLQAYSLARFVVSSCQNDSETVSKGIFSHRVLFDLRYVERLVDRYFQFGCTKLCPIFP